MADPNTGTVHVMEEEMHEAGAGVFEERRRRKAKAEAAAPSNKAEAAAPQNKSARRRKKA